MSLFGSPFPHLFTWGEGIWSLCLFPWSLSVILAQRQTKVGPAGFDKTGLEISVSPCYEQTVSKQGALGADVPIFVWVLLTSPLLCSPYFSQSELVKILISIGLCHSRALSLSVASSNLWEEGDCGLEGFAWNGLCLSLADSPVSCHCYPCTLLCPLAFQFLKP